MTQNHEAAETNIKAELVEIIREARAVIDTGWPMPETLQPETYAYDALQRSNLTATVANILLEAARRKAATPSEWDYIAGQVGIIGGRLDRQNDLLEGLLKSHGELQGLLSKQLGLLGGAIEMMDKVLKATDVPSPPPEQ